VKHKATMIVARPTMTQRVLQHSAPRYRVKLLNHRIQTTLS